MAAVVQGVTEVRTLVGQPPVIVGGLAVLEGTDLLDIVRLILDEVSRPTALGQISAVPGQVAADIALHVDLWFVRRRDSALRGIRGVGGDNVTLDDVGLVAELLLAACARP